MAENLHMHDGADYRLGEAKVSWRDDVLRADNFDDVYYSVEGGLAESRHVFLGGNGLPFRLHNKSHFTIAETGFGTGLNLLALMSEMQNFPALQLDYISLEACPLEDDDLERAHAPFAEVASHAEALRAALPPRWPGTHMVHLLDGRLRLHLLYGQAEDMLATMDFRADAWFLDGFSPAKNLAMWNKNTLSHVGRLTHQGGTISTFTVASAVREALQDAGFILEKSHGFGRKRHMLTGIKPNTATAVPTSVKIKQVAIIGGGIAGASIASGLNKRGIGATLFESGKRLASAASGNRMAVQSPRLAVDHNIASQLSSICLSFAARSSDKLNCDIAKQVISLDWPHREAVRQDKFRRQFWPDSLMRFVDAEEASALSGMTLPYGGAVYDYGRIINPVKYVERLAGDASLALATKVTSVSQADDQSFHINGDSGPSYHAVVLAGGADMSDILTLMRKSGIPLDVTSGQVSHIPSNSRLQSLKAGLSFGGYLTPADNGFHELGATFDRTAAMTLTDQGHAHNINLLPDGLAGLIDHSTSQDGFAGRMSQRASTPDRNPIMGHLGDRIYCLGALGARGITFAPLLGDMLAAEIADMPVSLSRDMRNALDPFRFRMRQGR
ncbi:FAD-dependent 5-carboxymethylaminomethyl-2-thiouridine(34) oxidoreductase MnmC [Alphaproteobacteria bacterium]|nr:FAD-dependent 5-carboxymethylaminomethyl-2-thiouridine(34) oxidoreductase MnmC [Alphaproteobacteria bacterium]